MKAGSRVAKPFLHFAIIAVLVGTSTAAYPQVNSVLEVVPAGTLACLRFENLRDFDEKVTSLVSSLNIPNVPDVGMAQLLDKLMGLNAGSLMTLENKGFSMKDDACVFWTSVAFQNYSVAVHASAKQQAEATARAEIGGTDKQHKGITYVLSKTSSAWVFVGDVFVYSIDESAIIGAIDTYLKEKPSILQDEKYRAGVKALRAGDFGAYLALDNIASVFLPLLQLKAASVKKNLSEQMAREKLATPAMDFDATKMLESEIDIGL